MVGRNYLSLSVCPVGLMTPSPDLVKNKEKKEEQEDKWTESGWKVIRSEVSHNTSRMSCVENPTKWFCQVVRRVQDARDVQHDDVAGFLPILNSKIADVDMT